MAIVMGLDQHRAQITTEWIDTSTGEVSRSRVAPAQRESVRKFLARFDGPELEVALEATTGWRFVVEELRRVGATVHLAEPAETAERRDARSARRPSAPPSSDAPGGARGRRSKGASGRSRGAQPGHEGKGRELLPTMAVDEVIEPWPERCGCGQVFCEAERVAVRAPARHQVEELP